MRPRRILRLMPAALVVLGVGSYAATLLSAHGAANRPVDDVRYVQVLGSSGSDRHAVEHDNEDGTIFLNGRQGRAASATWRLVPRSLYAGAAREGSTELFVSAPDEGEARPGNSASLAIDGRTIVTFRLPTPASSGPDTSGLPTAEQVGIDIPPGVSPGFTFPVRTGACPANGCALRVVAKGVRWRIRRLGILYTVPVVAGPALWQEPASSWVLILVACALAALTHLALSLRRRPSNTALALHR